MIQFRIVAATLLILITLTIPVIAQDDLTDEQYEELSRALDMSVDEIRAMNLPPDDLQVLLKGYTQSIVVVGSRAEPRTVTASAVPVDILSSSDLTRQGGFNLQEQLRTIVPSFPDHRSFIQCQHAAHQRRLDGGAAGDVAEPGPGPHARSGERQAPPPLGDH